MIEAALKVIAGIVERYGWQGLTVVVSLGAFAAIYVLMSRVLGQTSRVVDVLADIKTSMATQGEQMQEIAKIQTAHTEVVRTVGQELRGVADTVRQSDRERSRDILEVVKIIQGSPRRRR